MPPVPQSRNRYKPRCPGCGLPPIACACTLLPRLRFATPVVIVQHARERHKPTNTGRLFVRMAEGSVLLSYGARGAPFDPGPLADPTVDWVLLFPRKGAPVFDPAARPAPGRRTGIVLLDGTWSQCAHATRRLARISELSCAALPPGPPSFWTVRTQNKDYGRSTFEAAAQALELLEGRDAVAPLLHAFGIVTARLLHLKGKLPSPEIPAAWGV